MGTWLSVVIPARNSAATVGAVIAAARREFGGEAEIICVDDNSRDGTADAAAAAGAKVVRLHGNVGAARARNIGAREAAGEVILFLDADVVLQEGAGEALRRAFAGGADAVVGHYTASTPAPGFFSKYQNFYTFFNHDRQREGDINWFWTAIGALRKEVFFQLGGFSEHFRGASAEDMELGYKLARSGHRTVLAKSVRGIHNHKHTFGSLVRNDLKKSAAWSNVYLRLNRGGKYRHGFTGTANRVTLGASWLLAAGAAVAAFRPAPGGILAGVAFLTLCIANAPFYVFIARLAGIPFLLGAVPFHIFTNFLIGIGVCRGTINYFLGRRVR